MLRAFIHFAAFKLLLLVPAIVAFVVFAAPSTKTTGATSSVQTGSTIVVGKIPPSALSGTLNSSVYLPIVAYVPQLPTVYWGALVAGQAPSNDNMQLGGIFDVFEARAQKKMSILHWGQPWKMNGSYQMFYAPWFDNVRNHGAIPLIDWSSWHLGSGVNQPEFKLSSITNGVHDAYIRQWALDAKSWGHPFFLRFDWEMNGNWQFPWSEQLNGNQPGDYIVAWRHVHDIFTQNGVTNVTWVWCPNISSPTTRPMASLYPGDAYVDWTCLDGYNKYGKSVV